MLFADNKEFKENIHKETVEKLPKVLCESKQLYRECYAVNAEECNTLITLSAEACWKTFEKKMTADKTLNELAEVGNQIGQCTGTLYDMMLQKAKKADLKCLNDSKWLK